MKAVLLRTGSVPVHPSILPGSPRISLSVHDSFAGIFSVEKSELTSPRLSLHLDVSRRSISRASSEPELIRSGSDFSSRLSGVGSQSFPAKIPEEDYLSQSESEQDESVVLGGIWPRSGIAVEELEFSGGGIGTGEGRTSGGGNGGDGFGTGGFSGASGDRSKIGAYYQQILKSNPTDPLLLRNYAKYLHEVERDMVKAEEYCGRAILANPGDGEVLSLYGKLIWETQRDEERAKSYFDQAVTAAPDDCMVLGSYAKFLWEAEDDEEKVETEIGLSAAAMVEAF